MHESKRLPLRFGPFELDPNTGELRRNARLVRLPGQSCEVLLTLLEQPGELVTREILRERLWPADTFVDFEEGLNTAVARLRRALGDDAEKPAYVETLPRRGYRFIGTLEPATERQTGSMSSQSVAPGDGQARDTLGEPPTVAAPPAPVSETGPEPIRMAPGQSNRHHLPRSIALVGLVSLVSLVSLAVGWTLSRVTRPSAAGEPIHLVMPIGDSPLELNDYAANVMSVSPDGKWAAFVSNGPRGHELHLRSLSSGAQRKLFTNQGAEFHPFFSPDSEWVAFAASGQLFRAAVRGGEPSVLATIGKTFRGGSWGDDGYIVFSPASRGALMRVRADGGVPEPLTKLNAAAGENSHRLPWVLPGSRALLYVVESNGRRVGDIWCLRLDTKEAHRVVEGATLPAVVRGRYLVYLQQDQIMAAGFDSEALEVRGAPMMVQAAVQRYGISDAGMLLYAAAGAEPQSTPVWVDRRGRESAVRALPGHLVYPAISRDGKRFALTMLDGFKTFRKLWLHDIARDEGRQIAADAGNFAQLAVWTPDSVRLTFAAMGAQSDSGYDIFWRSVGDGPDEPLVQLPATQRPTAWSPNGDTLAFIQEGEQGGMWFLTRTSGKSHRARWATGRESGGSFSPDGEWIAYASDDSGTQQVYVRRADESGGRTQISVDGGGAAVWAGTGKEVFFRSGSRVMAVPVRSGPPISFGSPSTLFEGRYVASDGVGSNYDVTPDGERFLMIKPDPASSGPSEIDVVVGWDRELERLVSRER